MVETGDRVTTGCSSSVVGKSVVIINKIITTTFQVTKTQSIGNYRGGDAFIDATQRRRAFTYDTAMRETGLDKATVWRLTRLLLDAGAVKPARRVRNLDSRGTFIYAYPDACEDDISAVQRMHINIRKAKRRIHR